MNKRIFFMIALFIFILFGCGTNQDAKNTDQDVNFTKLTTTESIDQTPSNQAKELLSSHEEITDVRAINGTEKILIAIEIEHLERFRLKEIEKELKNKMKDTFTDYKVELSLDQKIVLEIEKLEEKLQKESIKAKELDKKIDKIIKLSKEQT